MWELPKYIRGRLSLSIPEIEMLIGSLCKSQDNIRMVDRYIQTRLTDYEIKMRENSALDSEVEDYRDWKDVEAYFGLHKYSFERQYFKKRIW
jgi:hypothetical protein